MGGEAGRHRGRDWVANPMHRSAASAAASRATAVYVRHGQTCACTRDKGVFCDDVGERSRQPELPTGGHARVLDRHCHCTATDRFTRTTRESFSRARVFSRTVLAGILHSTSGGTAPWDGFSCPFATAGRRSCAYVRHLQRLLATTLIALVIATTATTTANSRAFCTAAAAAAPNATNFIWLKRRDESPRTGATTVSTLSSIHLAVPSHFHDPRCPRQRPELCFRYSFEPLCEMECARHVLRCIATSS
mmetsp:Transcript_18842/g.56915  ORF Transcript_18842/g.56915 Transcript_18842/m.56915 type:complete len:248 (-) Transcript_18842:3297-4040(-)